MFDHQLLAFTGIAALLTITPGADTMLVVRNVLRGGRRAGWVTTLGICSGLFVHAVLSALGLSIILAKSATAYEVVRWAGALYLMVLGVLTIRDSLRRRATAPDAGDPSFARRPPGTSRSAVGPQATGPHAKVSRVLSRNAFFEGVANNVLNPKVAIFYLAFLPQFIGPDDPVLLKSVLLAFIHFTQGIVWLLTVGFLIDRGRSFLGSPRVAKITESISGLVLLAFGARLALETRR
ncbi:MAG: LysE family translocator [Candidatus Eisenbacteria bacterium]|uniref:LysE family translocator n=1 Tax=Eiseniibacteriota bacterium TaxID=2212470 RepID=A0A956LVV7_UNCEI|nr:LysE family translocator [Candidatus Eisenbacteria bacterium]